MSTTMGLEGLPSDNIIWSVLFVVIMSIHCLAMVTIWKVGSKLDENDVTGQSIIYRQVLTTLYLFDLTMIIGFFIAIMLK